MKEYFKLNKIVDDSYDLGFRMSSLVGAALLTTLMLVPVYIAITEFIIIFMYLINLGVLLFVLLFIFHIYLTRHLYLKAFSLKEPPLEVSSELKKLTMINFYILSVFGLLVGLSFIFLWIPKLIV